MPYIFGALVLANVAMFGYFWAKPADYQHNVASVQVAKAQLQKPIIYQNSTQSLPPLIGEK